MLFPCANNSFVVGCSSKTACILHVERDGKNGNDRSIHTTRTGNLRPAKKKMLNKRYFGYLSTPQAPEVHHLPKGEFETKGLISFDSYVGYTVSGTNIEVSKRASEQTRVMLTIENTKARDSVFAPPFCLHLFFWSPSGRVVR